MPEARRAVGARIEGASAMMLSAEDMGEIDPVTAWLLDRASDAIERSPEERPSATGSALQRWWATAIDRVLNRVDGRGPWTAGLYLIEMKRWAAGAVAFEDAAKAFEREVGHEHMWTAHALTRHGWCLLQLGRTDEARAKCQEALEIVQRLKPEDTEQVSAFENMVNATRYTH